jgi:uncharacterized membrane protein
MIETRPDPENDRLVWVVRPTRSLTWAEAKRWLYIISTLPLASGTLFLFFGIPLVLPFAGLEVGLLWAAFYYVQLTGQRVEIIALSPERLVLERGRKVATERLELDPAWARVELSDGRGWQPSSLRVGSHGRFMEVGSFLTDGERQFLANALINALKKSR